MELQRVNSSNSLSRESSIDMGPGELIATPTQITSLNSLLPPQFKFQLPEDFAAPGPAAVPPPKLKHRKLV